MSHDRSSWSLCGSCMRRGDSCIHSGSCKRHGARCRNHGDSCRTRGDRCRSHDDIFRSHGDSSWSILIVIGAMAKAIMVLMVALGVIVAFVTVLVIA